MAQRAEFSMAITPAQVFTAKFHPDGQHLFLSGSEDTHFMIVKTDNPSGNFAAGPTVEVHNEGIYDLAVSKSGDKIMTCSSDHTIKITHYPDTTKSAMHTKFEFAATSCAFSACENLVASGAQDGTIKITALVGEATTRKWKAHNGCVKGLVFDPMRKYLVSTGEDGMVCVWDYSSSNTDKVWSSELLPRCDMKLSQLNRPVWDTLGNKIAIPTYTGVCILERDSWKEWKRLQEHKSEVVALDWSPNGHYMISSHTDNSCVVWDLSPSSRGGGGSSLDRLRHQRKVIAVAWHPKRNSVALIDEDGRCRLWESVVGNTGRKNDPVKDAAPRPVDEYEQKKQSVSSLFSDADGAPSGDASGQASAPIVAAPSQVTESEEDLIGNVDRRTAMDRLVQSRAQAELNAADKKRDTVGLGSELVDPDDPNGAQATDSNAMDVDSAQTPQQPAAPVLKPKEAASAARRRANPATVTRVITGNFAPAFKLQSSFQPNASPYTEKRRYLCWNDVGLIMCRYDDSGSSYLDMEFTDQGTFRNFTSTKSFRARHGALGTRGLALASEGEIGIAGSILAYQAFDAIGMNADWQRDLGTGEVAEALALGTGFIAVATSNLSVRIFSEAGLQKFALTLPAPCVALVARGSYLAAFYHLGAPFGGTQNLGFSLWNVQKECEIFAERKCPLSLSATLVWAGFSSDESVLTTLDSTGIFRQLAGYDQSPIGSGAAARGSLYGSTAPVSLTSNKSDSPNWSGSWSVVLDSTRHRLMSQQKFWPVSLTKDKVRWVPCIALQPIMPDGTSAPANAEPAYAPQPLPRPVASSAPLEAALLNVDQAVGGFEESHLRYKIAYNHLKHRVIREAESQQGVDIEDSWRENPELVAAQVELDKSILRIIQSSCETDRVDRALDCVNELFLRKSLGVAVQIATKTEQIQLAQMINNILKREVAASERQKTRTAAPVPSSYFAGSTSQRTQMVSDEASDDEIAPPAKRAKTSERFTSPQKRVTSMYASDDEQDDNAVAPTQPFTGAVAVDDDDDVLEDALNKKSSTDAMDVDHETQNQAAPVNPFSKATKTTGAGSIFDTIKSMKAGPPAHAASANNAEGQKKGGKGTKTGEKAPKKKQQTLLPNTNTTAVDDNSEPTTETNQKKRKLFS